MMQVESSNLLDSFKKSWTLSSQESVQQWVDSLADDEYHSSSDDDRSKSRQDDVKHIWQSSLSVPESDDGLALGAEAKSFLGVSDILPLSPRLSPLLGLSEAAADSHSHVDSSLSPRTTSNPSDTSPRTDSSRRPPLPYYPSIDSNDTLPSGVASVSSLLAYLEPDPVDMLTNLGFGDINSNVFARVPTRFFQNNSSAKGVNTRQFVDTHLEDEKSSSLFTTETESVSMILGRFRENSIDLEFDRSSCRSEGVFSSRSSTHLPIPDIQIEEVDSSQDGLAFPKKLFTLPEENEALASPHGSFCLPDFRPPLLRQKGVASDVKMLSNGSSDEVFTTADNEIQGVEIDDDFDSSHENYFDDEKRVTVKRDSTHFMDTKNLSLESLDQIGAARKLSNASANPPTSREASLEVLDNPARKAMNARIISQNSDASTVVPPTLKASSQKLSDDIVATVIDGLVAFDDKTSDLSGSIYLSTNDSKPYINDSANSFAPSFNSAFDDCSSRSNSRLPSTSELENSSSPLPEPKDIGSIPSSELRRNINILIPVSDPFNTEPSPAPHSPISPYSGFASTYLERTEPTQPLSRLLGHSLKQKQKAFSVKNFSIESSGFEDENDPIRSPIKGTRTSFSSPTGMYDSCPLCGSLQSPGWNKTISSPTKLNSPIGHNNNIREDFRIKAGSNSKRHHSDTLGDRSMIQDMSEQLKHLKSDFNRQETRTRLYLDERLEQMRSDILSEISQFVLTQFDSISDTLKAKDAEILRLRRQLYEDSGTGL